MRTKEKSEELYYHYIYEISRCNPNDKTFERLNAVMGKLLNLDKWDALYEKYLNASIFTKWYYKCMIEINEENL